MKETENTTNEKATTTRVSAKAQRTTDRATAPASRAAKTAAGKADDAASAAKAGAERTADAASRAANTAARSVEAGRQAIVSASGQVAAGAKTAWTLLANRKLVAAGVGAGLTVLSAASFAAGRRTERHTHGPLTRLTGGRF
ncbi:hypothetical protein ABZT03_15855 [Streptomyces sp. NPDC005574]|uniref:hypothetical protein n=1 Tax=Streptomyces sp. NPDC005574 TaxID=3156891 RepID=UPI0033B334F4